MSDFKATLGLDARNLNKGFREAEGKAGGLERALGKVGSSLGNRFIAFFSAGAVINGIRELSQTAEDTKRMASNLSISTRQVQQLMKYAKETGKSFSEITANAAEMEHILGRASGADPGGLSPANIGRIHEAKGVMSAWVDEIAKVGRGILMGVVDTPYLVSGGMVPGKRAFFGGEEEQAAFYHGTMTREEEENLDREEAMLLKWRQMERDKTVRLHIERAEAREQENRENKFEDLVIKRKEAENALEDPITRLRRLGGEIDNINSQLDERGLSPSLREKLLTDRAKARLDVRSIGIPQADLLAQENQRFQKDLSRPERRSLLRDEISGLEGNLPGVGFDSDEGINIRGGLLRRRNALDELNQGGGAKPDALTSVGNFLGSDPGRGIGSRGGTVEDKQLSALQNIERNTKPNRGGTLNSFPL